ncbi:exported hypothetical protein [Bradyrhizobium sp. ORS 375]|uniref:peptidoglycan-binding domain-containing protein n=1 Tax=Bradyrhizobium sp. (strain ORS 375) TaxID=566679 RepID=UPI000240907B|nr:peptidoglycan-binding domain-containing protein [Bradyrhizobium sp. ORS 375]CCD91558.1 exported hypothetical protein [Bradyrhizobium sp. ORS 375]
MKRTQCAAAVFAATLLVAPAAMAQTAGGANNNAANANNGANGGGMASQRVSNENASGTGAILTISPSAVREVQQAMNRLGYAAGQVNGTWNQATADALLNFQQAHGLEPTGNLNLSSIAALGLWNNIIGNPLGNGNQALATTNGAPPPRGGKNAANVGGSPLPSQRITNEAPGGGQTVGSAGGQRGNSSGTVGMSTGNTANNNAGNSSGTGQMNADGGGNAGSTGGGTSDGANGGTNK